MIQPADNSDDLFPPDKRRWITKPNTFVLGKINSGKCASRSQHTICTGYRRTWLGPGVTPDDPQHRYGWIDDPCECSCHDSPKYSSRLAEHRESWQIVDLEAWNKDVAEYEQVRRR